MVWDFMGLNSQNGVFMEEATEERCKEPADGFEAFNYHQGGEIKDTKQAIPVTMASHFGGALVDTWLLGGVPLISHPFLPNEEWYSSKAPAQLTISYGGVVNVYDGISIEKAQAIMFMAGNGAFMSSKAPPPSVQTRVPTPMTPEGDAVSSSMSPNGGLAIKNKATNKIGGSATHITAIDTPIFMSSLGQATHSTIPQARHASLARFLEKRRERMMASAPYNLSQDTIECTAKEQRV